MCAGNSGTPSSICPDAHENEKLFCRVLLTTLPRHSLLLFDLGYFAFAWFDDLTTAGYLWVTRLREKTSYEPIHPFVADGETVDALVWLGAHRADRAKFAVRLIQFRQGPTLHRYLTNVLSPRRRPLGEVARLYARRWDIELAVNTIKTDLGLHLLWSAKPAVILHQVWAVLTIAHLLQALRVLVTAAARVDPFDVSLPLLIRYLPLYAARGGDVIAAYAADGERLGFIRPSCRIRPSVPAILPEHLHPPPPRVRLVRTPRYAHRKCARQASANCCRGELVGTDETRWLPYHEKAGPPHDTVMSSAGRSRSRDISLRDLKPHSSPPTRHADKGSISPAGRSPCVTPHVLQLAFYWRLAAQNPFGMSNLMRKRSVSSPSL